MTDISKEAKLMFPVIRSYIISRTSFLISTLLLTSLSFSGIAQPVQTTDTLLRPDHVIYDKDFTAQGKSFQPVPDRRKVTKEKSCTLEYDDFDPTIGKRRKELSYETLLTFTPAELKSFLNDKDLLIIQSRLTRLDGGFLFLSLKFIWNANSPKAYFGDSASRIATGFLLTDKKQITLYVGSGSRWEYRQNDQMHTMTVHLPVHPRQAKLLRKHFLKDIRIYWTTGYQDYPVFNTGLLRDQIECMD